MFSKKTVTADVSAEFLHHCESCSGDHSNHSGSHEGVATGIVYLSPSFLEFCYQQVTNTVPGQYLLDDSPELSWSICPTLLVHTDEIHFLSSNPLSVFSPQALR